MKLINLNSKKGIINLFADYILKSIDPNLNTIIQITEFNYLMVINGMTESSDLLDLSKIKDKFFSENQNLLVEFGYKEPFKTLDLIQYNKKITNSPFRFLWSTMYNSKRPVYHESVIEQYNSEKEFYSVDYDNGLVYELDYHSIITPSKFKVTPLQISSEFPYGYSLSMDRLLLYYSEYIVNQIIKTSMSERLDIYLTNQKNSDGEQILNIKTYGHVDERKIKSMVLDLFTFEFDEFKEKIKSYDLCEDIKSPLSDKPWLIKDKNQKDLIIF